MKFKLNVLAAAVMGVGLVMAGPNASAQTIDGGVCDSPGGTESPSGDEGLGNETCAKPDVSQAEGTLFVAAEQAVSIVAAIADSDGCFTTANRGAVSVSITTGPNGTGVWQANTTLSGAATYLTRERVNSGSPQQGARVFEVSGAGGALLGSTLSALTGEYITDHAFSILIGDSDFRHRSSDLDEHIIKDFYQGIPRLEDANPNDPLEPVVIVRDNGLEVTTKKHFYDDLFTTASDLSLLVGSPKGKWRQTSFYRYPNGPGDGALRYTKVKIAPFGDLDCLLRLQGTVTGNRDQQIFNGNITVAPAF